MKKEFSYSLNFRAPTFFPLTKEQCNNEKMILRGILYKNKLVY